MFDKYRQAKKRLIDAQLLAILDKHTPGLAEASPWGKDIIEKIKKLAVAGKTIRGTLVFLGGEMFGYTDADVLALLACSMELIQSALIIHDDIMDNDLVRRGQPTIFAGYIPIAEKEKFGNPLDFGKSMGICGGDLCFFLAINCLAGLAIDAGRQRLIFNRISEEINRVTVAQMSDLYFGNYTGSPTAEEINRLYRYKTARYTFSLPLSLGAIAGGHMAQVGQLEKLGEYLGIIFQIRDDELGLLGDEKEIGKPVGSDIRENKKTLIRHYLYRQADDRQRQKLDKLFGKKRLTDTEIKEIKTMVNDLSILPIINKNIGMLVEKSKDIIRSLPIGNEDRKLLDDIISYIERRQK